MTPNPFTKQYLMTAGPTPVPPAGVPGDGRADALPPRAGLRRALRARARRLPGVFRTPNDVLAFAVERLGRDGVRGREPRAPGRQGARLRRRQVRRALDRALRGLRRRARRATSRAGASGSTPAEIDRLLARTPASRSSSPRSSETSTGIVHDVQAIAEVVRRHGAMLVVDAVSGLGAAELRQDEWGVDVVVAGSQKALMCPPGLAFASVSERALEYAGRAARRPLLLRLGQDRQEPAQGRREPVHARRHALPRARRRARHDRGGGPGQRARPPRRCSPARRAPAPPPSASTFTATRTSAPRSSRRSSCRTTSTAARCRAPCASSASPPTAARTTSRAGSCASPTAATSAPSTSSPRSPGLEMVLAQLGHEVEHGAGVGAAQRCSSRRASPPRRERARPSRTADPRRGEDRRLRRRPAARALRRRRRRRTGTRTSSPSASATTTAS